jgi:hypothetical protein
MTTINPQRRQQLLDKFPALRDNARPMNPAGSTQVRAVERADQIVQKVWRHTWNGDDPNDPSNTLFDPARVAAMAQRADAAAADFHRREADAARERALGLPSLLRYDTHDGSADCNPDDPAEQGVVRIWPVGTNHVDIVRDRWHDSPNRRLTTAEYAAGRLGLESSQHDFWDCRRYGCDGDCELKCGVRLAKACGGTTRLLPVNRGALVLLFRCCRVCEGLAGQIAENTYKTNEKIAEIEGREFPPDL